jgi:glycosyltransferase involved in cell wall biosynthesis
LTPNFEIQNQKVALPQRVLYATSARLGGSGLDAVVRESVRVAEDHELLGRAIVFADRRARRNASSRVQSLRWHPVRLLASFVGREFYYGAKKQALDRTAARALAAGAFDFFHGWSGECLQTLRVARARGVPSVIEIPTWHRHKGKTKPLRLTMTERKQAALRGWAGWKNRLRVTRQAVLEEYELADLLLVLSERAEETFLHAGVAPEKLFRHQRGVDTERFTPAPARPEIFRALFVGALIERKGVHHLLRAWAQLGLRNAELVLAGTVHDEMRPWLEKFGGTNVRVAGFVRDVETLYRSAALHVFPSSCEGSAKSTYEAAACGLAQITTRESGDIVIDGVNGLIIPADNPDALAEALQRLHADRAMCERFGAAGRERVVAHFTWAHFGERMLQAYRRAMELAAARSKTASS